MHAIKEVRKFIEQNPAVGADVDLTQAANFD
jgi:hypothetical protein